MDLRDGSDLPRIERALRLNAAILRDFAATPAIAATPAGTLPRTLAPLVAPRL